MSYLIRVLSYQMRMSVCEKVDSLLFNRVIAHSLQFMIDSVSVSVHKYHVVNHLPTLKLYPQFDIQKRNYAKSRDKPKGDGKQVKSHMTESDLAEIIDVERFKKDLESELQNLKEDFVNQLSIRTSLGSLHSLPVVLEGDTYPLSEIAQIIQKTPTSVLIQATAFPQATSNIKKAILESGMNLNPQQEGTTFYVPLPKVTKEHREALARNAKTFCDKTKTQLKEIQNKYIKKTKAKAGKVSEDSIYNAHLKIREMTRDSSTLAETLMKNKQNDLIKTKK